jgi:sugar phosphate isomerase/epimerase
VNYADFGMDAASLAGSLEAKLAAIRNAGFSQVMLSAADIVSHPAGTEAAVRTVIESGLRVTGFQALRDFEGLTGHLHGYKLDIAKSMLALCHRVRARLLLVEASMSTHAADDRNVIARDLRKLATLALPFNVDIAFKGLPWSRTVAGFLAASDVVYRSGSPNLGIVIDALHFFGENASPLEEVETLEPQQIMLVQLSDCMWHQLPSTEEELSTATHFRVFPGEGVHSDALSELVTRLDKIGYYRDFSFAVYNDDYQQLPPEVVADRARKAAVWLGETVLRRSLPVPNMARLLTARQP